MHEKFACTVLLITITIILCPAQAFAGFSMFADYDYSNYRYYQEGVVQVSGQLVSSNITTQGDLNAVRVGACAGASGEKVLFGFDFAHAQGSTPTVDIIGADTYYYSAYTKADNARIFAGYLLHDQGDAQIRIGYGYEQITMAYFDIYPKQTTFNYLFAECKEDLIRSGNSAVQVELSGRFNFKTQAANFSQNYNETIYYDSVQTSFGIAAALPLSYGFNNNVSLSVKPWYSYNKRGYGTSTSFQQAGQDYVLAPASFQQYGMSLGAVVKF